MRDLSSHSFAAAPFSQNRSLMSTIRVSLDRKLEIYQLVLATNALWKSVASQKIRSNFYVPTARLLDWFAKDLTIY